MDQFYDDEPCSWYKIMGGWKEINDCRKNQMNDYNHVIILIPYLTELLSIFLILQQASMFF